MSKTIRTGAAGAALLLASGLVGCSSSATQAATTSGSVPTVAASSSVTALRTPTPTVTVKTTTPVATKTTTSSKTTSATASAHPTTSGAKTCPSGDIIGVIGGVEKCLAAGQDCSSKNAADYTKYGFTCTLVNGTYILRKAA